MVNELEVLEVVNVSSARLSFSSVDRFLVEGGLGFLFHTAHPEAQTPPELGKT
ncbi:UNVERIFIED_CONTAM: hypothetical protein ABIC26_001995 [Paenibacillus sp. PvR008]